MSVIFEWLFTCASVCQHFPFMSFRGSCDSIFSLFDLALHILKMLLAISDNSNAALSSNASQQRKFETLDRIHFFV